MSSVNCPPVPVVVAQQWFDDPPKEPGYYWFYGDPRMGQMGGHYDGTIKPKKHLVLVEIKRISNGVVGIADGNFITLRKWNGKQQGCCGQWTFAVVPDIREFTDK